MCAHPVHRIDIFFENMSEMDKDLVIEHKFVQILGGMNDIYHIYQNNNLLTTSQQTEIEKLLKKNQQHQQHSPPTMTDIKTQRHNLSMKFHKKNTLFHRLFSPKTANYLYNVSTSSYIKRLWFILYFLFFTFNISYTSCILNNWHNIGCDFAGIILVILALSLVIFYLFFLFTANVNLLKKIFFSFTFLFKLYHAILWMILQVIIPYYNNGLNYNIAPLWVPLGYFMLVESLIVAGVSNGIPQIPRKFLAWIWVITVVVFMMWYINGFIGDQYTDDVIVKIFSFEISLKNKSQASLSTLIVFYGKEAFLAVKHRNSTKLHQVDVSPNVVWIDESGDREGREEEDEIEHEMKTVIHKIKSNDE